ncbi:MAG: hypothetical protein NT166_07630 [Candidatus Aminicenantes bacterium]|nr:hypothetical protein [Candidatus Aminicenantes bacterium]
MPAPASILRKSALIWRASAKFCLDRQKFASSGIHSVGIDNFDAEIDSHFAQIGKILPQSASIWWKSTKPMWKSAPLLRYIGKNLPLMAKFCLARLPFGGSRQNRYQNRHVFGEQPQKFASIDINLADIHKNLPGVGILPGDSG